MEKKPEKQKQPKKPIALAGKKRPKSRAKDQEAGYFPGEVQNPKEEVKPGQSLRRNPKRATSMKDVNYRDNPVNPNFDPENKTERLGFAKFPKEITKVNKMIAKAESQIIDLRMNFLKEEYEYEGIFS